MGVFGGRGVAIAEVIVCAFIVLVLWCGWLSKPVLLVVAFSAFSLFLGIPRPTATIQGALKRHLKSQTV